jgi:23S rRNA (uracil1939-C5)-methyltransferase
MSESTDWLDVESVDLDGQGVCHDAQGKVVFVEGALAGERVQVKVHRRKARWEQGTLSAMARESASRVRPRCPHFGLHAGACGGCKLQHLEVSAQVAVKQRALEDALWHLGKVRPATVLRPLEGLAWGYRDRARLSVRHVAKKGAVLVGFHERKSSFVADMTRCEVLAPRVAALLVPLRDLVMSMDARDRLPQIEVAVGGPAVALVLRHLEPLGEADETRLRAFAAEHRVQWWLQPKGPDSAAPLDAGDDRLAYVLPEFGLEMAFRPTDFTQVNHALNERLVSKALRLLDAQADESVVDWFCGLGNFTLPLATQARRVRGLEGSQALVERAASNARRVGLAGRASFEARDLFTITHEDLSRLEPAQAWLIDPPREGALALVRALGDLRRSRAGWEAPGRIVYVSCNPATLARDAGLLVHHAGYRLAAAGVANMFPHTTHIESLAHFVRAEVPDSAAAAAT